MTGRSEKRPRLLDLPDHARGQGLEVGQRMIGLARPATLGVDHLAHHRGQAGARNPGDLGSIAEGAQQLIDRGQAAQGFGISAHAGPPRPWTGPGP